MGVVVMWSVNIAFLYLTITHVCAQLGGPYDLIIQKVEECKDTGTHEIVVRVKTKQVNKITLHATGNVSLGYDITDKILVQASVGKIPTDSGMDWDKTTKVLNKNFGGACTAIRSYAPDTAKQLFKLFGYPPNQCPKKGDYNIDGNLEFILAGVPVMIYGKFRVDISLYWASYSKRVGCFFCIADFVPKKTGRKRKGK